MIRLSSAVKVMRKVCLWRSLNILGRNEKAVKYALKGKILPYGKNIADGIVIF